MDSLPASSWQSNYVTAALEEKSLLGWRRWWVLVPSALALASHRYPAARLAALVSAVVAYRQFGAGTPQTGAFHEVYRERDQPAAPYRFTRAFSVGLLGFSLFCTSWHRPAVLSLGLGLFLHDRRQRRLCQVWQVIEEAPPENAHLKLHTISRSLVALLNTKSSRWTASVEELPTSSDLGSWGALQSMWLPLGASGDVKFRWNGDKGVGGDDVVAPVLTGGSLKKARSVIAGWCSPIALQALKGEPIPITIHRLEGGSGSDLLTYFGSNGFSEQVDLGDYAACVGCHIDHQVARIMIPRSEFFRLTGIVTKGASKWILLYKRGSGEVGVADCSAFAEDVTEVEISHLHLIDQHDPFRGLTHVKLPSLKEVTTNDLLGLPTRVTHLTAPGSNGKPVTVTPEDFGGCPGQTFVDWLSATPKELALSLLPPIDGNRLLFLPIQVKVLHLRCNLTAADHLDRRQTDYLDEVSLDRLPPNFPGWLYCGGQLTLNFGVSQDDLATLFGALLSTIIAPPKGEMVGLWLSARRLHRLRGVSCISVPTEAIVALLPHQEAEWSKRVTFIVDGQGRLRVIDLANFASISEVTLEDPQALNDLRLFSSLTTITLVGRGGCWDSVNVSGLPVGVRKIQLATGDEVTSQTLGHRDEIPLRQFRRRRVTQVEIPRRPRGTNLFLFLPQAVRLVVDALCGGDKFDGFSCNHLQTLQVGSVDVPFLINLRKFQLRELTIGAFPSMASDLGQFLPRPLKVLNVSEWRERDSIDPKRTPFLATIVVQKISEAKQEELEGEGITVRICGALQSHLPTAPPR